MKITTEQMNKAVIAITGTDFTMPRAHAEDIAKTVAKHTRKPETFWRRIYNPTLLEGGVWCW